MNQTQPLSATVSPVGANQEVTWESDKTAVATVDANGVVSGVAEGSATIKVSSKEDPSKFDTCSVTVVEKPTDPVTDIILSSNEEWLNGGQYALNTSTTITVEIVPSTASQKFTIREDEQNKGHLTVKQEGNKIVFSGVKDLSATNGDFFYVKAGDVEKKITIHALGGNWYTLNIDSLTPFELAIGGTKKLTTTTNPELSQIGKVTLTYTSDNDGVLSMNSTIANGVSKGTANVTGKWVLNDNNLSWSKTVKATVKEASEMVATFPLQLD